MRRLLDRFFGWLGRRHWISRIDRVLNRAHERGVINSWLWHALDDHLKYHPERSWHRPDLYRRLTDGEDVGEEGKGA
jgi:hypothetical protein